MPFPTPLMTPEDDCQHSEWQISSLIGRTSGDKNVFHDCDMSAPFSGLPLGGEGERTEEKSVLKVWRYTERRARENRDAAFDWLSVQAVTVHGP